jgi:AcrR family transcriptional regulator
VLVSPPAIISPHSFRSLHGFLCLAFRWPSSSHRSRATDPCQESDVAFFLCVYEPILMSISNGGARWQCPPEPACMPTMPATPTTKKGLHTRSKILDAAALVFARDGYVEARMLDIATEAQLSTGGLYRYFDNKTEVFAALIADIHEEFYNYSGHTRQILGENPLAALTEANRGYIEHYHRNRHVMRALVEAASVEKRFGAILHEMRQRHVRRFVRTYRELTGRSEVRGVPVDTVTEALACMVEQCCYVWFALDEDFDESTSVDDAVRATSETWFAMMFA